MSKSKHFMDDMIKIKKIKKNNTLKQVDNNRFVKKASPPNFKRQKKEVNRFGYRLWLVAVTSALFLFFGLSYTFSKAHIVAVPKIENISIKETLSASKDSNFAPISFDLMVITAEEKDEIETEIYDTVQEKAKGVVVLYNNFSSRSQTLSVDTRLEGSNGKIYKTEKRITIPGIKNDQPGKIEVGIYGTEVGEEYNSGPLDFKIFGFKNTPKYEKIYARSKGEITGGVQGDFYTISSEQKEKVLNDLKSSLRTKLFKKATEQIPKGFILFEDAMFLSISDFTVSSFSETKMVPVSFKGILYGFLFNEAQLTKKIVTNVINDYNGSDVYIANIPELTFSLINKEDISFSEVKDISFTLAGSSKIVWKVDVERLTIDLLGRSKKDFNLILSKYPNITTSSLTIKPFWRMSLPDKVKHINIIVNYPE